MIRLIPAVALVALLGAQDPSEPDRLVGELGSQSAPAREKAENRLVELGEKAIPALKKAAAGADPEVRARATAALEDIDRLAGERKHDQEVRAELQKKSGMAEEREKKQGFWQLAWTGGAVFRFSVLPWKGGLVLSTHFRNYLAERPEEGLSDLRFDVAGASDKDAKELGIDRCGLCSPFDVYVRETSGPIKVHLKGVHRWWSLTKLEFPDPKQGDRKKVGDFTVEIDWPTIKVTSRKPYPKELLARVCSDFGYDVKPGVQSLARLFDNMGVGVGGGGGGRRGGRGDSWCHCKDGPKPVVEPPAAEQASEFVMKKGRGLMNDLGDVAQIRVWIRKPIDEPIDFTQEIVDR